MRIRQDEKELAALARLVADATAPLHAQLQQAITQWDTSLRGMRTRGATPARVLTSGGNQNIAYGPGEWAGFLLTETTGTASASVSFYNGRDELADLITTITLAAGESTREVWPPRGVTFSDGLFLTVTGAVAGSVLLVAGA